jgi:hypothetical protein
MFRGASQSVIASKKEVSSFAGRTTKCRKRAGVLVKSVPRPVGAEGTKANV